MKRNMHQHAAASRCFFWRNSRSTQGAAHTASCFRNGGRSTSARPAPGKSGGFLPEGRFECQRHHPAETHCHGLRRQHRFDRRADRTGWLPTVSILRPRRSSRRTPREAMREMLQALLAERFGLAVHDERRYAGVLADGRQERAETSAGGQRRTRRIVPAPMATPV